MQTLLHSRKFWLSIYALVQAIILHYLEVPPDIIVAVSAVVMVLVGAIATEDAAAKISGGPDYCLYCGNRLPATGEVCPICKYPIEERQKPTQGDTSKDDSQARK